MSTSSFPVLKLPFLAVKHVIKTMETDDMMFFALCSKKMKGLVRSNYPKSNNMEIVINESRSIITVSGSIYFQLILNNNELLKQLWFIKLAGSTLLRTPNMNLKDWIDLLIYIFAINNGVMLSFHSASTSLKTAELIDGHEVSGLCINHYDDEITIQTLEKFMPSKELKLYKRPSKEEPYLRDIITKNFDSICLMFPITLEELYSINASSIKLRYLSIKDFNEFLKNWANGGNPALKKLEVKVDEENEIEEYLVDYLNEIDIDMDTFKVVKKDWFSYESFIVKRSDGTTAEVLHPEKFIYTHFTVLPKSN